MSVTSGFFNSVSSDRRYNAEQIGNYFEGLIGNGVFQNVGNKLVVEANGNLDISVGTGRAMINCHWLKNDSILSLALDAADIQYTRIDAVVVKLNQNNDARVVSIEIKKGTPSINPSRPELIRTNGIYEICLATIVIPANANSITQTNITDQRGNSNLCGYVTGLIDQVDTSDLFLQYQTALQEYYQQSISQLDDVISQRAAEFDAWFQTLTSELRVDTKLIKYENTVQIEEDTYGIDIGIPAFAEGDILIVHVNGVLLTETTEFVVADYGEDGRIQTNNEIEAGNEVTFIVIKNVIGSGGYRIMQTSTNEITLEGDA